MCVDKDTWDVPQERIKASRGKRKTTYVVPPSDEYDSEVIKRQTYKRSDSSDSDDDVPLAELERKYKLKAEHL
ncbi:hypothetical protein DPMN_082608 [Dreissena polymorpha]|uniref:Uncharacterized protein n=1 Tax=Dreissena polymorpha TaxID=45954 RepID=A0A9D4BHG3_DREPO|nr:hypothetical protein DPMN_082608 [Dreissena polymorpha]